MNILLITNNLDFQDPGFYTVTLARGLQKQDHEVTVAAPPGPLTAELERTDVPYRTFSFLKDPRLEVFKTSTFCSRLDTPSFDLIHAHDLTLASFVSKVARRLDLPCFLSMHEFEEAPGNYVSPDRALSGVITPNEALREHAVNDLGMSKSHVDVIPPGVDLDRLRFKPVFRDEMQTVVAMSTPLERANRVELLPVLAHDVARDHSNVSFLVLGQGPLESDLRKRVNERGISDQFIFHANQELYFDVLSDVDVLLGLEPRLELGLFILQAMGCGKPVITSGAGGAYHVVVDGETGYLVSLSDGPAEMINRLRSLLAEPERARTMGKRARELVEDQFTMERMVQEITTFFERRLD